MKGDIMGRLSFDEFTDVMDAIREAQRIESCIDEAFLKAKNPYHKDKSDFIGIYGLLSYNDDALLKVLEVMFDDHAQWISYFVYELDWGKEWKQGAVTDADGTDIPLGTLADLYHLIVAKQ